MVLKRIRHKITSSTQISNIVSNSFWNILASLVLRGNIFLVNIVIARLIGAELFGKYALIKSSIQVFELSLGLAFGLSMTKYISEFRYNSELKGDNRIFKIVRTNLISTAFLSVLLFLIMGFSSEYLTENVLNNSELIVLFRISIFYILFNNIVQCFVGILKGEEKFKKIFHISLITGFLNISTATILTLFYSLNGAIYAFVIFSVIQLIMYTIVTVKETDYLKRNNWKSWKLDFNIIKKFNIPAVVSALAAPPAIWYINVMLSKTESGYQELAYFNSAYQIFALIVFLPISISDATFPILNKYLNDIDSFRKVFFINLLLILGVSLTIASIPFFFPNFTISIFGEEFKGGSMALKYLTIAAVISSLLTFLGRFLATINKMWFNVGFNYLWAFMVIILATTFIEAGAVGVAKSYLFSYLVLLIIQLVYSSVLLQNKSYISTFDTR